MVRRRTALGGDGGGSQGTVDDSDGGDGSQQLTDGERAIFGEVDDGGGTTDTTTTDTTTTTTTDPFGGPRERAVEQTPEPEPEPDPTPFPEPTTGTPRERAVEQTPEPAPEPEPIEPQTDPTTQDRLTGGQPEPEPEPDLSPAEQRRQETVQEQAPTPAEDAEIDPFPELTRAEERRQRQIREQQPDMAEGAEIDADLSMQRESERFREQFEQARQEGEIAGRRRVPETEAAAETETTQPRGRAARLPGTAGDLTEPAGALVGEAAGLGAAGAATAADVTTDVTGAAIGAGVDAGETAVDQTMAKAGFLLSAGEAVVNLGEEEDALGAAYPALEEEFQFQERIFGSPGPIEDATLGRILGPKGQLERDVGGVVSGAAQPIIGPKGPGFFGDLERGAGGAVAEGTQALAGATGPVTRELETTAEGLGMITEASARVLGASEEDVETVSGTVEGVSTGAAETAGFLPALPEATRQLSIMASQEAEAIGETAAEQGFQAGAAEAGETTADVGVQFAEGTIRQAQEEPLQFVGSLGVEYLSGAAAGRALGMGARRLRDRTRTAGGTEVDVEDITQQEVLEGEAPFPQAADPDLYETDPAAAVRQQASDMTPDEIQAAFEQAGVFGTTLKKALGDEPEGPGRGRASQGFESAPGETGIDPEDITPEMVQSFQDSPGPFDYEAPGSFFAPEFSTYFLRTQAEPTYSFRPGLPSLGGRPTGVLARVDVEEAGAGDPLEFARELAEREGEATALTKPAGQVATSEIEAAVPPGAQFVDVGSGPGRGLLRGAGVGTDFFTTVEGRRVPLRLVAPEADVSPTVPTPTTPDVDLGLRDIRPDVGVTEEVAAPPVRLGASDEVVRQIGDLRRQVAQAAARGEAVGGVGEDVGATVDRVRDALGTGGQAVGEAVPRAGETVGEATRQLVDDPLDFPMGRQAGEGVGDLFGGDPLASTRAADLGRGVGEAFAGADLGADTFGRLGDLATGDRGGIPGDVLASERAAEVGRRIAAATRRDRGPAVPDRDPFDLGGLLESDIGAGIGRAFADAEAPELPGVPTPSLESRRAAAVGETVADVATGDVDLPAGIPSRYGRDLGLMFADAEAPDRPTFGGIESERGAAVGERVAEAFPDPFASDRGAALGTGIGRAFRGEFGGIPSERGRALGEGVAGLFDDPLTSDVGRSLGLGLGRAARGGVDAPGVESARAERFGQAVRGAATYDPDVFGRARAFGETVGDVASGRYTLEIGAAARRTRQAVPDGDGRIAAAAADYPRFDLEDLSRRAQRRDVDRPLPTPAMSAPGFDSRTRPVGAGDRDPFGFGGTERQPTSDRDRRVPASEGRRGVAGGDRRSIGGGDRGPFGSDRDRGVGGDRRIFGGGRDRGGSGGRRGFGGGRGRGGSGGGSGGSSGGRGIFGGSGGAASPFFGTAGEDRGPAGPLNLGDRDDEAENVWWEEPPEGEEFQNPVATGAEFLFGNELSESRSLSNPAALFTGESA